MLFLIIAKDGDDADAPARRQAVRARHLEGAQALAAAGTLQLGGALLDAEGAMIGSAMLVEAPDEAAVHALVARDVYSQGDVWREYEVYPFKRAI